MPSMAEETPAEAWEAKGQRLQAEINRVRAELFNARENERWDAANQFLDEWNRLNDELAKHMKKRPHRAY